MWNTKKHKQFARRAFKRKFLLDLFWVLDAVLKSISFIQSLSFDDLTRKNSLLYMHSKIQYNLNKCLFFFVEKNQSNEILCLLLQYKKLLELKSITEFKFSLHEKDFFRTKFELKL